VSALNKDLACWIHLIGLERLECVTPDVKRLQPLHRMAPLREGASAHGLDFALVRLVPTLHDDHVLDVPYFAGRFVVQHTGAFV
jgi:hypothetical protein